MPILPSIIKRRLLLCFEDEVLEAKYLAELQARSRRPLLTYLYACVVVISLEALSKGSHARLGDFDVDLAAWATSVSRFANLFGTLFCVMLVHCNRFSFELVALMHSCIVSSALFSNNAFRMTKLFGTKYWHRNHAGCDYDLCYDDSTWLMCLVCGSCVTMIYLHVRVSRSCMVGLWSSLVYGGASCFGLGPLSPFSHVKILVLYMLVFCFIWCGCRSAETEARQKWLDNRELMLQVADQQEAYEKQSDLLCELEERMDAMRSILPDQKLQRGPTTLDASVQTRQLVAPVPPLEVIKSSSIPGAGTAPNELLERMIAGRVTDRARVRRMAEQIREPRYSLGDFFWDSLAAFPELQLFFANHGSEAKACTSSGNGGPQEYQRTIGALFAVYWLLRLDIDGKQGFCFGCSENFEILEHAEGHGADSRKRAHFFDNMDWSVMQEVVDLAVHNSVDRIEAMLCLTAFHDIFKLSALLPVVSQSHGAYDNYKVGEVIHDHDIALAYVLENFPALLPSFAILPEDSRDLVTFTQNKMQFNHGWFVQAEGTPGGMLSSLKAVLADCRNGDLSFYFFHWLTDLSGAEGTPLGGAEKFTLRFPQAVLSSFLWSIPHLQRLKQHPETAVVQDYLHARFSDALPHHPPPDSETAIACMRLAVMAQAGADIALRAFDAMPSSAQQVLATEMARTGIADQHFLSSNVQGGPAFLVYYGPALLQRCTSEAKMVKAMSVLAAVYSAARALWPLGLKLAGQTVTLEIGQLKTFDVDAAILGHRDLRASMWVMVRRNSCEASVELMSAEEINSLVEDRKSFVCVDLGTIKDFKVESPPVLVKGKTASVFF